MRRVLLAVFAVAAGWVRRKRENAAKSLTWAQVGQREPIRVFESNDIA